MILSLYDGFNNCNCAIGTSSKSDICLNDISFLTITVSVAKCCTTALSGTMPCSFRYSYKYIVAKKAGTYP